MPLGRKVHEGTRAYLLRLGALCLAAPLDAHGSSAVLPHVALTYFFVTVAVSVDLPRVYSRHQARFHPIKLKTPPNAACAVKGKARVASIGSVRLATSLHVQKFFCKFGSQSARPR